MTQALMFLALGSSMLLFFRILIFSYKAYSETSVVQNSANFLLSSSLACWLICPTNESDTCESAVNGSDLSSKVLVLEIRLDHGEPSDGQGMGGPTPAFKICEADEGLEWRWTICLGREVGEHQRMCSSAGGVAAVWGGASPSETSWTLLLLCSLESPKWLTKRDPRGALHPEGSLWTTATTWHFPKLQRSVVGPEVYVKQTWLSHGGLEGCYGHNPWVWGCVGLPILVGRSHGGLPVCLWRCVLPEFGSVDTFGPTIDVHVPLERWQVQYLGKKDEQLDLLVVIKDFLKLLSMIVLDHHWW